MSNFKYDISEGSLIVDPHPDAYIEVGIHPADIYDLGELLLNNSDIELKSGLYPVLDCDDWTSQDYKSYARWLLSIITEHQPGATTPTEQIYKQAYYLGIGPEPKRIARNFGRLWKFHEEVGFDVAFSRGIYDDWSKRDFVEYGRRVVRGLGGRKPTEEDFYRWYTKRKGPNPSLIRRRVGGLGPFQELLGFPYIANWSEEDYVDYGVKVTLANPGITLTRDVFDELSRRKRGPSTRTIVTHFDKLSKFQGQVIQEAIFKQEQDESRLQSKVKERQAMFEKAFLPPELNDMVDHTNERLMIQQTSEFILVSYLFKDSLPMKELLRMAMVLPQNLIASIRARDPSRSAGNIEVTAAQLDIFDDIWPMDDYLEDLKVSPRIDRRKNRKSKYTTG